MQVSYVGWVIYSKELAQHLTFRMAATSLRLEGWGYTNLVREEYRWDGILSGFLNVHH